MRKNGKSLAIVIGENGACPNGQLAQLLQDLQALEELSIQLVFTTEGVSLVTHDSPVLAQLRALEVKGVPILTCSTCLSHAGLRDQVAVGKVGSMTRIMEAMQSADQVAAI
jgi:intracellular sulfur oxidation DsrE/DsrF family protein